MPLTKQEIISRATPYFLENGYNGIGMNQLLDQLKMSKGGFYHHFKSKEELAIGVAQSFYENKFHEIESIAADSGSFQDKVDQIAKVMQSSVAMMCDKGRNICLYMFEMMQKSKEICSTIEQNYSSLLHAVEDALQQGVSEGELQSSLNVTSAALHLVGLVDGLLIFSSVLKDSMLNYVNQVFQQFYNGVKAL